VAAPNIKGGIVEYFSPASHITMTVGATAVVGGNVVKLSGNRTVIPTVAAADLPCGVALHDAAVGEKVTVALRGVFPLKAIGAIAAGDLVGPSTTSGSVATQAAAGGTYVQAEANLWRSNVGQALEAIATTATGRVALRL